MSNSVYQTVNVRIKTEVMTKRKRKRLNQITGRDSRIIKEYMKVILHNEEHLITQMKKGVKVNRSKLDKLALTTSKNTKHTKRAAVSHDLKRRFLRSSHDELIECRDKAVWTYESWKAMQANSKKEIRKPIFSKKTPRLQSINRQRFIFNITSHNTIARGWVGIRDALDTNRLGKARHQRLWLPLSMNPYHEHKILQGTMQSLEIKYHTQNKQWWVSFTIKATPSKVYQSIKEPAVLGIDLGDKKTATSTLLTPTGKILRREIHFWNDNERKKKIKKTEKLIGQLQRELNVRENNGICNKNAKQKLKTMRKKLNTMLKQDIGYNVNQMIPYIKAMSKKYDLYVTVGYPVGIRKSQYRGNYKKKLRKIVHKWRYNLFITTLKHKMALMGFSEHRIIAISESWTSKRCSRCGLYKTGRQTQAYFHCHNCNYQLNADINGAKNIARRLIQYVLQPKANFTAIRDLLTNQYHSLKLFRSFNVLSQWL